MKSISKVNFMVQPSEKELGKGLPQGQGSFIHSFTFFSVQSEVFGWFQKHPSLFYFCSVPLYETLPR